MAEKLTVGQKLILDYIGGDVEGVVTKVGTKWASIEMPFVMNARDDLRVNMADMMVYAPNRSRPHCRAFLSIEARNRIYAEKRTEMDAEEAWRKFKGALSNQYGKPSGLGADAIRQAAALLGIQLPTDGGSNGC